MLIPTFFVYIPFWFCSEYKDYIPFATSSPIIEVNYHTKYETQNTEACALKLFESFPPLMGM